MALVIPVEVVKGSISESLCTITPLFFIYCNDSMKMTSTYNCVAFAQAKAFIEFGAQSHYY